jgi:hypothetical protein
MKKSLILIGLMVCIVGLGLHLSSPGKTRSGFPVNAIPFETVIENLNAPNTVGYGFGIELLGPEQIDFNGTSAFLLTDSQYTDYLSGTPLNETGALISLELGGRGSYETTLTEDLDLFIVVTNHDNTTVPWSYYYYLLPSGYYPSFTIAFIGFFITIIGFILFYDGWKRLFLTGVGIQSLFFFVRVFTLSTYSLGLPEIFWELIHTELYNDYQYFYLSWIPRLWEGAWAYSADLAVYLYPPLWIYTVGIFGSTPSWLPGMVLFTFNAATGVLIYKIMNRLTDDDVRSKIAMMLYMLNPFTLFYGSFMWLNPIPYVFFVMLSFYYALTEKDVHAFSAIAVATLYKQFAVIFFPILVILFVKRKTGFKFKDKFVYFLKSTAVYAGIVGFVSLPFLIVSGDAYLNQMILWNTGFYGRLIVFIPDSWMTVHANTFFLWLGFPSWFVEAVAFMISNYVFLILCGILVYGGFSFLKIRVYENSDKIFNNSVFMKAIFWSFVAVMSVQLFYPRGAYKFYLLILVPFIALMFDYGDIGLQDRTNFQFEKHHLFGILISLAVFLCYRFVYFWLLGAWVAFYFVKSGVLGQIVSGISRLFRTSDVRGTELEEIYSE